MSHWKYEPGQHELLKPIHMIEIRRSSSIQVQDAETKTRVCTADNQIQSCSLMQKLKKQFLQNSKQGPTIFLAALYRWKLATLKQESGYVDFVQTSGASRN